MRAPFNATMIVPLPDPPADASYDHAWRGGPSVRMAERRRRSAVIKPATRNDAQDIADLAVDSGLFAADDAGIVTTMMADYFGSKSNQSYLCVLDEDDEPLAVAYYEAAPATDRTWYLTMIAVRHSRQGQGRGGRLMQHVEDDLRARGQRLLLVATSGLATFRRARAFYERCGFEQESRVRDYYEPEDDLILFRKAL